MSTMCKTVRYTAAASTKVVLNCFLQQETYTYQYWTSSKERALFLKRL
jgi:hypothetical protein